MNRLKSLFRFTLLAIIPLLFASSLYGQNASLKFKKFKTEDGLPTNNVYSLFEDSKGYIWLGTGEGLCRFDGYDFTIFQNIKNDTTSLSADLVYTVAETRDGRIWAGTLGGGLNVYSQDEDIFRHYKFCPQDTNSVPDNSIRSLYTDSNGDLWVGTNEGFCKYLPEADRFRNYRVKADSNGNTNANFTSSFLDDRNGHLWVGTITGGLNKFTFSTGKIKNIFFDFDEKINLHFNMIWDIGIDKEGILWLATNRGLVRFDPETEEYKSFPFPQNGHTIFSDKITRTIMVDSDGEIWLGSVNHGLINFDPATKEFVFYKHHPYITSSISADYVTDILQSRTGLIWAATKGGGINHFQKTKIIEFAANLEVHSIYKDDDANLWIGTEKGLIKYSDNLEEINRYEIGGKSKKRVKDNIANTIMGFNDDILIGTKESGLVLFNKRTGRFSLIYENEIPSRIYRSNRIKSLVKDSTGNYWFTNFTNGITKYSPNTNSFTNYFYVDSVEIPNNSLKAECLLVTRDNKLFIGTSKHGLIEFDIKTENYIIHQKANGDSDSLASNYITYLLEGRDGSVWIGSYSSGIIRYDRKKTKFESISAKHSLPSNMIMGILEDNAGDLWFSTNKGISKYNPRIETFTNFSIDDGLQGNYFFSGACFIDRKGLLYFGGLNGVNIIDPSSVNKRNIPPNLVISQIKVYDKRIPLIGEQANLNHIYLSHEDDFISIEFSALEYRNLGNLNYQYKLVGIDKEWVDSGTRRYVSYTNLPGGEYRFKVKVTNLQNNWASQETTLVIFKDLALWENWWFKIFVPLLVFGVGYFLYKKRIESLNKQKSKLENLVDEKTKLIEEVSNLNYNLEQEINERKKAEFALIGEKEKAEKSERLKSEFLAQMSHEIRSPINIILSYTSLLRDEMKDIPRKNFDLHFNSIDSGGRRIIRTIDMILNMSEINTGTIEINPTKFDLNTEVLQNLHQEYVRFATSKDLELNYFDKSKNSWIYADQYSVTQILSNLIDNAIKYTKEGKIDILLFNTDGKVNVEIVDTGIGISQKYIPSLFNPFSQEESGYTRKFEGTGLGLALVKKYCELNDATISVESVKGKGSKFTVTFPITENPNI